MFVGLRVLSRNPGVYFVHLINNGRMSVISFNCLP
jgi:hypothetical protein